MAVITASGLTKHVGARPLFADVSFKLERGDRMTLAGRNGSGKTTLLRTISGEAGLDAGTISLGKGVRVALHDQRPPRGDSTLRDYVTAGLDWIAAIEDDLGRLERRMADGIADEATLAAYADAQARLEHAGGYRWRDSVDAALRGLGFRDARARPPAGELLRRRADPGLARPGARLEAGPAAARRAHQPPRHRVAGVAGGLPGRRRRRGHPRRPRPLVPGVGRDVGARARGRPGALLQGPVARLAGRAGRPRAGRRPRRRAPRGRDRADGAVRRAVPLQGDEGPPGAVEAEGDRAGQGRRDRDRPARRAHDGVLVRRRRALRAGWSSSSRGRRSTAGERTLIADGELWLERGEHVSPGRRQRLRQDDAGRDAGRQPRARARQAAPRPQRQARLPLPARRGRRRRRARRCSRYAQHATGLSEAKTRALLGRFLFSGDDVFKRLSQISGGEAQRLALALLTNSDANLLILDEPTNHLDVESREALEDALTGFGGTVLLISHDRALLEAVGSRTVVIEDGRLVSHPGGWAEYRAARGGRARRRGAARAKAKPDARRSAGPSKNSRAALAKLEREVEEAEADFKRLEDELADPSHWSDPKRSAKSTERHERARARLAELIARWEEAAEKVEG